MRRRTHLAALAERLLRLFERKAANLDERRVKVTSWRREEDFGEWHVLETGLRRGQSNADADLTHASLHAIVDADR